MSMIGDMAAGKTGLETLRALIEAGGQMPWRTLNITAVEVSDGLSLLART